MIWKKKYDGFNKDDLSYTISIDKKGCAFVSGVIGLSNTNSGITTIKYATLTGLQNSNNIIDLNFSLSQNYPNPFNPKTKINYSLPIEGIVKITIYNSLGQTIKELVNEFKGIGSYTTEFNGSSLSSGIYYYKIETGNFSQVRKMILIK
ncbi:MAG: T9SS type A sorting domain-containing protein [bacterium]